MGIICTQSDARHCRSRLHLCYLCGEDLGDSKQTSREHIIPRAVLGKGPSAKTWTPLLDVHQTCERNQKRPLDEVYALLQKMASPMASLDKAMDRVVDLAARPVTDRERRLANAAAARFAADAARAAYATDAEGMLLSQQAFERYIKTLGVPEKERALAKSAVALLFNPREALSSGHYRKTVLKPADDIVIDGMNAPAGSFALDGIEEIMAAVWNWVRGFHALVYANCLPNSTHHDEATPYLEIFIGTTSPRRAYDDRFYSTIQDHLDVAARVDKADGVRYWDQKSGFLCAWVRVPVPEPFYRCLWRIDVPGPKEPKVWYGWYNSPVLPGIAKTLSQADFSEKRKRDNTLPTKTET